MFVNTIYPINNLITLPILGNQNDILNKPVLNYNDSLYLFNNNLNSINNLNTYYPIYNLNNQINLNNNPELRDEMVNYFWNKLLFWIRYSSRYSNLYDYLVVDTKTINIKLDTNQNITDQEQILKYNFLIENVIEKNDLYYILDKFCSINAVNWWDLRKNGIESKVKIYIHYKIVKYLKNNLIN